MTSSSTGSILAIDIGGTKIAATVIGPDGVLGVKHTASTPATGGAPAVLQAVIDVGRRGLDSAQRAGVPVVAVGVGSAGEVDVTRGVITYASDNLPGWSGLPLAERLQAAFGLPVAVENDVNALALGEHHCGAGRGLDEVLYVAVGTGVGGALVRGGELWRGATWSAGEICHLVVDLYGQRRCSCGEYGHLEAYTCGPAMEQRYAELTGRDARVDLRSVAAATRQGDAAARQAIAEGGRFLGMALGGVCNLLDPQAVVIGGGVAELGPLWWQPLENALRANPIPGPAQVLLRRAELGVDAVLVGAAWFARSRLL